jgi:16S rRNA processing protein RimM
LGVVKEIYELPAQDVLVMLYKGKDVMIPMTQEFVIRADKENKQMITNLPEGLVEMYLEV